MKRSIFILWKMFVFFNYHCCDWTQHQIWYICEMAFHNIYTFILQKSKEMGILNFPIDMLGKDLDVKCNYFYRLLDNETIFERYNFKSSTADSTVINVWTSYTLISMCEHLTHCYQCVNILHTVINVWTSYTLLIYLSDTVH